MPFQNLSGNCEFEFEIFQLLLCVYVELVCAEKLQAKKQSSRLRSPAQRAEDQPGGIAEIGCHQEAALRARDARL